MPAYDRDTLLSVVDMILDGQDDDVREAIRLYPLAQKAAPLLSLLELAVDLAALDIDHDRVATAVRRIFGLPAVQDDPDGVTPDAPPPPETSEADQRAATDAEFVKLVETNDGIETRDVARHFGFTTAYTNLRLGQLAAKGLLRRSGGKHWHLATGQVHGEPKPEPAGGLTEPPLYVPHVTNTVGPEVSPEPVEGPVEGPVNNEPKPDLSDPLAVLDYVKHHSPTVVEFANHFGITEEQANQHLGLMISGGAIARVGNRFEANPSHLPELPAWQPIDTLYADLTDKQSSAMRAFRGPDEKSFANLVEATGADPQSTRLYSYLNALVDKHLLVVRGTCPKTWQRRVLYPLSASSRGCLQDLIARCCCITPQTADQLRQRIGNRCTTDAFRGELKRMLAMDELLDIGDGTYLSRVWPAPAEEF